MRFSLSTLTSLFQHWSGLLSASHSGYSLQLDRPLLLYAGPLRERLLSTYSCWLAKLLLPPSLAVEWLLPMDHA